MEEAVVVHGNFSGEGADYVVLIEVLVVVKVPARDIPEFLAVRAKDKLRPVVVRVVRLRLDGPVHEADIGF